MKASIRHMVGAFVLCLLVTVSLTVGVSSAIRRSESARDGIWSHARFLLAGDGGQESHGGKGGGKSHG